MSMINSVPSGSIAASHVAGDARDPSPRAQKPATPSASA